MEIKLIVTVEAQALIANPFLQMMILELATKLRDVERGWSDNPPSRDSEPVSAQPDAGHGVGGKTLL